MILSAKDIERLAKAGEKLDGLKEKERPSIKSSPELHQLRIITGLLSELANKPTPKIEVPTVKPPDVVVNKHIMVKPADVNLPKHPARIKKWRFVFEKDYLGQTTVVTATAIE